MEKVVEDQDKTFDVLRRVPFSQMNRIRSEAMIKGKDIPYKTHGWTSLEFHRQYTKKYIIRMPQP